MFQPGATIDESSKEIQVSWDVEVDESAAVKFDVPPEMKTLNSNLKGSDTFTVKAAAGMNSLIVDVEMKVDHDVGFASVEGEESRRFKFALIAPAPTKIKVSKKTIVVGSFEFNQSSMNRIKSFPGMLNGNQLNDWYSKLPQKTRDKIELEQKPPGDKMIRMTGYTDNVGPEYKNFELGGKRARAVAEAFGKRCGVAWQKIITAPSKGEQDNLQENKKLEKNEPKFRRVEVEIFVEE
jgi:outer membrane protein OmpA-like peptidoglycan-associated protein